MQGHSELLYEILAGQNIPGHNPCTVITAKNSLVVAE
jgi:hypothetical protein